MFKRESTAGEFETLISKEIELFRKQQTAREELHQAEAVAGAAYFEGVDSGPSVGRIQTLQAASTAIGRALGLCRSRRGEAIAAEYQAKASGLRAKAAEHTGELERIRGKIGRLLEQLSEIEKVSYDESILALQPGTVAIPRSITLANEVTRLQRAAEEMDRQEVPVQGFIDIEDVTSRDVVITAVLSHRSAGPDAATVSAWLDDVDAYALQSRNAGFGEHPRRVRVEWKGGAIDRESSYILCPAAYGALPFSQQTDDASLSPRINVQASTFRAAPVPDTQPLVAA